MGRRGASEKKGGRPPCVVAQPTLEANLRALLQEFTAGDPMREGVLWTNLSLRELSRRLLALGAPASQPPHDSSVAEKTQGGPPHGAQEKDDGSPSRSQRAIRKHRPPATRV